MIRFYTARYRYDAWLVADRLRQAGIRVHVFNQHASSIETEHRIAVDLPANAAALDISAADLAQAIAFLIHAHYVSEAEPGGEICITRRAVYYLEAGAYQRQTIRD